MDLIVTLIVLLSFFHRAFSSAHLEVLSSPDSLILKDTNQPLLNSDYAKFASLALGYSSAKPSNWDGFFGYKNFANIPHSIVTFHLPLSLKPIAAQVYELDEDSNIENQYDSIAQLMSSKYQDSFPEKVALFDKKANSLQDQFQLLNSYISQLEELKSKGQLPQRMSLWFNFASPSKVEEASLATFQNQIQEIVVKFKQLFNDKVIIVAIENQDLVAVKRKARQGDNAQSDYKVTYNLAYEFDADYHTAFATIGFTTIILLLTVFGVSVAMWNIDPGRDSIIYRLTSQKIKKDQ